MASSPAGDSVVDQSNVAQSEISAASDRNVPSTTVAFSKTSGSDPGVSPAQCVPPLLELDGLMSLWCLPAWPFSGLTTR